MAVSWSLAATDNRQRVFLLGVLLYFCGFYWLEVERLHKTLFYILIPIGVFCAMRLVFWRAFFQNRITGVLLLYIAYQLISVSWSVIFSWEEVGEIIRKGALSLCFVAAVTNVAMARHSEKLWFWPVVLLASLAALYSSLGFVFSNDAAERMTGIGRGKNPIQTAALYGSVFIAAGYGLILTAKHCCMAETARRSKRLLLLTFWLACWGILLIAMLLTESRAAMLAAVGAQFFIVLRTMPLKWAVGMLLSLLVVLLFVATQLVDLQHWLQRADSFRLEIWQSVFSQLSTESAWLWGLGYRTPFELLLSNGQVVFQPHSLYVSALYYGGVVGLICLLTLFVAVGRELLKAGGEGVLFLALWLNSLVFALVDYNILLVNSDTEWILFWLPIGAATAIAMQRHKGAVQSGNQEK